MMTKTLYGILTQQSIRLRTENHRRRIIHQYDHQEICKMYLGREQITQDEYDQIIAAMGGEVRKL